MRRALVLTDESARHPFRASLPAHVLQVETGEQQPDGRNWPLTMSDVRGFATAYTACLIAVLAFII